MGNFLRRFGIAAILALGAGSAAAEEVTLRVHHFLSPLSTTHKDFIVPWAERVEAQSGGRIAVEIYPSMQLGGSPPNLYDQVRDGVADVIWTLPGYTPGRFPLTDVFELPFVAANAEATSQALQEFYERHLTAEYAEVHVLMLHAHAAGSFHIRDRAVASLEDLRGLRIRAPSRITNQALEALGVVPVGMPVPQVPEALSRGVVDGALLPYEVAHSLRVHELVDHHTEVDTPRGFYTATFLFAMNRQVYEGLPGDLKAVIDANSGLTLAREIGAVWDRAETAGRQAAAEDGDSFTILSEEEAARWRERMQPVIESWIAEMDAAGHDGAALLEEARSLVAKYAEGEG